MLNSLFKTVKRVKFEDCEEGYIINTDKCQATIGVSNHEVVMSYIWSSVKGGGSEMIDKLESYSKSLNKTFVISNITNSKLLSMVKKRGYVKDNIPFSPDCGIMDLIEVYRKIS